MGRSAHIAVLVLAHICISSVFALEEKCLNCSSPTVKWTHMKDCRRTCNGETKTCYLRLHVERYTVLGPACRECENGVQEDCLRPQCVTADGYQRSMITLNRMMPAPAIDVCRNDKLIVDVVNMMEDETTSIHWHGFRQVGTQYYDGAPHVTQCPIDPGTTFRYKLNADDAGSFFLPLSHSTPAANTRSRAGQTLQVDEPNSLYDESTILGSIIQSDTTQIHIPSEESSSTNDENITASPGEDLENLSRKVTVMDVEVGQLRAHARPINYDKLDGVAGSLIVRDVKENDIQAKYYDEDLPEHVVFLTDWTHVPAENLVPGLHSDTIRQLPVAFFIGGRGKHYDPMSNIVLPRKEFVIEYGKRYRFRLVSSTCMTCGIAVTFEGHTLTVISADGGLTFHPVEVKSVIMNPADRFDVVLNAIQPPGGVYTITLRGVGSPTCANISQEATLRYKIIRATNKVRPPPPSKNNLVFNNITSNCESLSDLCISHLRGTDNAPKITNSKMYHQLCMEFGIYTADIDEIFKENKYVSYEEPFKGTLTIPYMNNISFSTPPSPVISQIFDIPQESYCSDECRQRNMLPCSCTNVYEIKKNSIVDLILWDKGNSLPHPMHLHGNNFWVLEMSGKLPNDIAVLKKRLRNDEISLKNRPQRDTISVPPGGYAAIRFKANNPGPWFLHCHFAFHQHGGMAVILIVGKPEDLPPVPKHFPKCGNFVY